MLQKQNPASGKLWGCVARDQVSTVLSALSLAAGQEHTHTFCLMWRKGIQVDLKLLSSCSSPPPHFQPQTG